MATETKTSFFKRMLSVMMAFLIVFSNLVCGITIQASAKSDSPKKELKSTDELKDSYSVKLSYERKGPLTQPITLTLLGKSLNGTGESEQIDSTNGFLYRPLSKRSGTHFDKKSTQLFPTKIDFTTTSSFLNFWNWIADNIKYTLTVNGVKVVDNEQITCSSSSDSYSILVDSFFYPYIDKAFITADKSEVSPSLNETKSIETKTKLGDQYDVVWKSHSKKSYSIVDLDGNVVSIPGVSVDSKGTVHVTEEANDSPTKDFRVKLSATENGHTVTAMTENIKIVSNADIKKAKYTVNHYKQNIKNDEYSLEDTQELTGIATQKTNVKANVYAGFTAKDFSQKTIDLDGSTVVNIYYNRNIHKVTFDDNGGTGGKSYNLKFGDDIIKPTVTRVGYSFDSWTPDVASTMPDKDITYQAKWLANTKTQYTVEHYKQNLNDDKYTLIEEDTQTLAGETDTLTKATSKNYEGFTPKDFKQVNINGDGSTVIKIYYERDNYTATFNPENGEDAISVNYRYGELVKVPKVENENYKFTGWFTDKGTQVSFDNIISGDITVNAHWAANTYNLTFDAGKGNCAIENMYVTYDSVYGKLPKANRYGYTFAGWFTKEGVEIKEGNTVKISGDQTVYAKWNLNEYTATFMADGKVVGTDKFTVDNLKITEPKVPDKSGYNGRWEEYTLTDSDIVIHAAYTPVEYTATFVADGEKVGEYTFTVENLNVPEPNVPNKIGYTGAWEDYKLTTADIKINAVYTPINYTATFIADGKIVGTDTFTIEDLNVTEPSVPDKAGYIGSWGKYNLSASDITINAKYTPIEYTATFMADGEVVGTDTFTIEDLNVTAPEVPNKAGYTGAWEKYELSTSDITVNAIYNPKTYTATFIADNQVVGTQTFTVEDKKITEPKVPIKTGYTGAWEKFDLTASNITINAFYTPIVYTATFMAEKQIVGTDTFTIENLSVTEPAVPQKVGFSGAWEEYTLTTSDITINAVYEEKKCIVTFDANGGTCSEASAEVDYGSNYSLPTAKKPFKRFAGWFTSPDGGTQVTDSDIVTDDITLYAHWTSYVSEGLVYTLNSSGTGYIVGTNKYTYRESNAIGTCKDEYIVLPDTYQGLPVVAIGQCAFRNTKIKGIKISNNITVIGNCAFIDCSNLTLVKIPSKVNKMGFDAFENCSKLTDITIPSSIKEIGSHAFAGCIKLTRITIPSSVETIGNAVCLNCTGLKKVYVNNDKLSSFEFQGCTGLTSIGSCGSGCSVEICDKVSEIKNCTFRYCSSLKSIPILKKISKIGSSAFKGCTGLTEITIPSNIKDADGGIFEYCTGLKKVYINNDKLFRTEFYHCTGLTSIGISGSGCSVELSDKISEIGDRAFENCTGLTEITIPSSINDMNVAVFEHCTGLRKVYVNNDKLYNSEFEGCTGLKSVGRSGSGCSVELCNKVSEIGFSTFSDCKGLTALPILESIESIGAFAFRKCVGLKEIAIPSKVIKIQQSAFKDCTGLRKVYVNNDKLYPYEFEGCTGLTSIGRSGSGCSVELSDKISQIGDRAFENCTGLTEITIPSSINDMDIGVFEDCIGLRKVYVNNDKLSSWEFEGCTGLTSVGTCGSGCSIELCNNVRSVGKSTFERCKNLNNVTLPSSITEIGNNAFSYCTALKSIYIPSSVNTISTSTYSSPFYRCSSDLVINCEASSKPDGWDENWNNISGDETATTNWGQKI